MNFTDKNITVNSLLDLSKKEFIIKYKMYYETKTDSIKSELESKIDFFYKRLPYLKDFLKYISENNNSRILINEFFNELKENYALINSKDYKYFSELIDQWNDEIKIKTEEKIKYHKEIYQREQNRKIKSPIEYDSKDYQDIVYLSKIPEYGKFDIGIMRYVKNAMTEDFYSAIKPNFLSKEFLDEYIQFWNNWKSDFNAIVQLSLELFSSGQLFSHSFSVKLDDIKEFEKISSILLDNVDEWINYMKGLPELRIKENFCKILLDIPKKDWGGELNDHYTSSIHYLNDQYESAFLFKGPAGGIKFREMKMKDLGKNADQINRLFKTNARLVLLQHCHMISEDVKETMDAFAYKYEKKYCIIDGRDTYKLFKAYNLL